MTGVSKKGCVLLAQCAHRDMMRARRKGEVCVAMGHRLSRDSWLQEARQK